MSKDERLLLAAAIFLDATGGVLVAAVLRKADNVIKESAASAAGIAVAVVVAALFPARAPSAAPTAAALAAMLVGTFIYGRNKVA